MYEKYFTIILQYSEIVEKARFRVQGYKAQVSAPPLV